MSETPFKVKAIFDYTSPHEDDLSFSTGQIITVTDEEDTEWYVGEYTSSTGEPCSGLFPRNFVEKYEPEIPSRPARSTRPKAAAPPATQSQDELSEPASVTAPLSLQSPAPTSAQVRQSVSAPHESPATSAAPQRPLGIVEGEISTPTTTDPSPKPKPKPPVNKEMNPPVAEKPSSFKDRIAAFNKSQAAPVLPFKPSAAVSAGYGVKKQFVAPPPSRDAYVPTSKPESVPTIYHREEDPEIIERISEDRTAAEHAGLIGSSDPTIARETAATEEMDQPKPQSLKERIALLQQQQVEQAQKRADVSTKEKVKRPTKKRTESSEGVPRDDAGYEGSETSMPARKSVDTTEARTHPLRGTVLFTDGNEADQSAAGETTEPNDDTSDNEAGDAQRALPEHVKAQRAPAAPTQEADVGDEEDSTEDRAQEDDDVDDEARRKAEIRERMAKISGGMGLGGMFGGPQPGLAIASSPKPIKTSKPPQRETHDEAVAVPLASAHPMIPIPGMAPLNSSTQHRSEPEVPEEHANEEESSVEQGEEHEIAPYTPPRRSLTQDRAVPPPPIPGDRPVPPLPPSSSQPVPERLPSSDLVEQPVSSSRRSIDNSLGAETIPMRSPPPPVPVTRTSIDTSRPMPPPVFGRNSMSESTTVPQEDGRLSRPMPPPVPIPQHVLNSPELNSRHAPPSMLPVTSPGGIKDPDEGQSEYEGDYDTDIGSSEKHRDALKVHNRYASVDQTEPAQDRDSHPSYTMSPAPQSHRVPPPPPPSAPPTAMDMDDSRKQSLDVPRAAPPPVPVARAPQTTHVDEDDDDGLDLYKRYQDSIRAVPPPPPPPPSAPPSQVYGNAITNDNATTQPSEATPAMADDSSDDLYSAPTRKSTDTPRVPPPPPARASPRIPEQVERKSLDVVRSTYRKSMDINARSLNDGYMACDIDLAEDSGWWAQPDTPPPSLAHQPDILFEIEESATTKRGGKTIINKDIYILYPDYSQTIITALYDSPSQISDSPLLTTLEQRHEPPPPRPRQDQLESSWHTYGRSIADAALAFSSRKDLSTISILGDGRPSALPLHLFPPTALKPIGTRSYGAQVYVNIGNASVQQHDEIRPGDVITFRNARFQGKHGGFAHTKYALDVGMLGAGQGQGQVQPHVGVVVEWDGTKKKVKVLEQGRVGGEEKGAGGAGGGGTSGAGMKVEGYRLGDLKSGEVRVWRVVGRSWVGWDK